MEYLLEEFGDKEAIKMIVHDGSECNNISDKEFIEKDLEIALDSGAVSHACSDEHTSGYELQSTPASRAGANFVVGDGATIPNQGQKQINISNV